MASVMRAVKARSVTSTTTILANMMMMIEVVDKWLLSVNGGESSAGLCTITYAYEQPVRGNAVELSIEKHALD